MTLSILTFIMAQSLPSFSRTPCVVQNEPCSFAKLQATTTLLSFYTDNAREFMSGITWNNLSSYNWGLFSLVFSILIHVLIYIRFFLRLNNILLNVCTLFYLFVQILFVHTQVSVTHSPLWVYSYEHGRENSSLKLCFEWFLVCRRKWDCWIMW